jgi:hypothetical protein
VKIFLSHLRVPTTNSSTRCVSPLISSPVRLLHRVQRGMVGRGTIKKGDGQGKGATYHDQERERHITKKQNARVVGTRSIDQSIQLIQVAKQMTSLTLHHPPPIPCMFATKRSSRPVNNFVPMSESGVQVQSKMTTVSRESRDPFPCHSTVVREFERERGVHQSVSRHRTGKDDGLHASSEQYHRIGFRSSRDHCHIHRRIG